MITAEAPTLAEALSNFSTVMTSLVGIIEGNTVIFTMFAGGLLVVAAKVFKRIKNSVK